MVYEKKVGSTNQQKIVGLLIKKLDIAKISF